MTDKVQELRDAAFALLPFLTASTDPYERETLDELTAAASLSRGDRLRREAEQADNYDVAIIRLREALANFAADVP